jgi:type I restriction enzyme S subunit
MSAVDDVSGTITKQYRKLLGSVKKGYTYFKDNDVLFAKITPCMENGKSAIAKKLTNGIGFGSTEFHVIRPSKEISPQWIHSYIRQPWYREEAKRYFTSSVGQQRVPEEFIKKTEIPLPPLSEQERIVKYLDELREKVDRMKKLQQEQLSELKELKNSILNKAFKGELVK